MKDRSSAESAVLTGLQVSGLVRGGGGVRMWCWGGGLCCHSRIVDTVNGGGHGCDLVG